MAAITKANDFVEHLAEGQHDFSVDTLVAAFSNTAPTAETSNPLLDGNGILANVTQVSYTYATSRNITVSSSSQTGGTYKLVLTDLPVSASGGSVGPFRYVYIYNSTALSVTNPIIGVADYGSSITLSDGESITLDFDPTNGFIQVT